MKTLILTTAQHEAIQARIKASARKVQLLGDHDKRGPAKGESGTLAAARKRSEARHGGRALTGPKRGERAPGAGNRPKLREADVLRACMGLLEAHPKVALWWRVNSGAVKIGDRFVKFAFRGASDLMGVMADGEGTFLAVECKATGGRPSEDQEAFLANVNRAGGYGLLVYDPAWLFTWLENI